MKAYGLGVFFPAASNSVPAEATEQKQNGGLLATLADEGPSVRSCVRPRKRNQVDGPRWFTRIPSTCKGAESSNCIPTIDPSIKSRVAFLLLHFLEILLFADFAARPTSGSYIRIIMACVKVNRISRWQGDMGVRDLLFLRFSISNMLPRFIVAHQGNNDIIRS